MKIGALRQRVTHRKFTAAQDSYGEEIETWATNATVWARVEPLNSRDFYAEQQLNSEVTGKIYLRYRTDVTEKDRFVFDSETYEIVGQPINPNMEKRWLICKVKLVK